MSETLLTDLAASLTPQDIAAVGTPSPKLNKRLAAFETDPEVVMSMRVAVAKSNPKASDTATDENNKFAAARHAVSEFAAYELLEFVSKTTADHVALRIAQRLENEIGTVPEGAGLFTVHCAMYEVAQDLDLPIRHDEWEDKAFRVAVEAVNPLYDPFSDDK